MITSHKIIISLLVLVSLTYLVHARFLQPDSKIPDPYNPQTLDRYVFELNNPYKYTDPTGHIPVTSQMGTVDEVYDYILSLEEGNSDLDANQVLRIVEQTYRTYGESTISQQGTSSYSPNFVYTESRGVIDQRHFFTNARFGGNKPSNAFLTGVGYAIEVGQIATDRHSAFTYEDLVSNAVGREFGNQLSNKQPLSSQYKQFMDSLTPKQFPQSLVSQMPKTEQGYKPSAGERKYTSSGKALPQKQGFVQRTISKIKSFF